MVFPDHTHLLLLNCFHYSLMLDWIICDKAYKLFLSLSIGRQGGMFLGVLNCCILYLLINKMECD